MINTGTQNTVMPI